MAQAAKRPRSAKNRTLPPDVPSLEQMFRAVHRNLVARAEHLQRDPHDTHARRGFQTLCEQRAAAWQALAAVAPNHALQLAVEFGCSHPPVAREVQP